MKRLFSAAIVMMVAMCACEPSTAPSKGQPLVPIVHHPPAGPRDEDIDELGVDRQGNTTEPITDRSPVIVEGEEIELDGGDGSSQALAIVIVGKRGVKATRLVENAVLFRAFGKNIRFLGQERIVTSARTYELVTVERANGRRPAVWFDVTDSAPK